ncbi:MFS transporter [Microlunatus speluncae]|uniref:MFS transporter n=1 Tax=Microlunatus speluncae TaxID=2594267 RepID=UPI0012661C75|nr:MFS transporter [Microlunatus speluncae]
MRRYRRILTIADFRWFWFGATVSSIGDGMTFVALTWLVLSGPDPAFGLALLAVLYTAPAVLGGVLAGPILDHFDKRTILIIDSVIRAAVMASIPATAALDVMPAFLPFVAAATYGLLKMIPLAGFPAAIPSLVPESELDSANALESLSFSVAGIVGPAAAGLMVGVIGAPAVLAIDSLSFLIFALALIRIRQPLNTREQPTLITHNSGAEPVAERASIRRVLRDPVIIATTIAFMAFNVAEGMLLVLAPWLAKTTLTGGAASLGLLLALLATGEIIGAVLAGAVRAPSSPIRAIGSVQAFAAVGYLSLLLTPDLIALGVGFLLIGLLSAPMTVWAQSLRMRRIPSELHGRTFAVLRTLMQGTLPLGTVLATPFIATDRIGTAAVVMTSLAGLPGVLLLLSRLRKGATGTKLDNS